MMSRCQPQRRAPLVQPSRVSGAENGRLARCPRWLSWQLALWLLISAAPLQALEVTAQALLPGMAVLVIDGQRVTLRAGGSHGAVRLIEVSGDSALLEIDGEQRRLGISERVSGSFQQPERREVRIQRNSQLQYVTTAQINGKRVQVLVDTGANLVAMNRQQARSLGISDDAGSDTRVQTASEVLPARQILLDSVSVGGIRIDAVNAVVIDGPQPATILLGMSYLRHVSLSEEGGVLSLSAQW